jgi:hypothetical protein
MRHGIDWRGFFGLVVLSSAVVACNGATVATGSPAPTSTASASPPLTIPTLQPTVATTPSATPSPSAAATASPTPLGGTGGSGSPLPIDPCSLLTTDQASAINGVSYAAGVSHVMGTGSVECVWQSNSPHASVVVQVAILPSVSEAEVAYAEAQAQLQGATVEKLSGFADEAAIVRSSAAQTGGIYARDGSTFFDVVYLNGTVPSDDQLKYAATLVLGALP